jgi:hypothetical protein
MLQPNLRLRSKVWFKSALRDPGQFFRPGERLECPCCGYSGRFATGKRKDRVATRCPNCESKPRDRQVYLYLRDRKFDFRGARVLHFAPEWPLFRMFRDEPNYVGGDIIRRRNANAIVDITKIDFPDDHFDYLLCNHVLEHVREDRKGMQECYRVMKPGGRGVFTVPLSDEYETWEPPAGMSVAEIERTVGWDHKRLYGLDFADKLRAVGFEVSTERSAEPENSRHRLFAEALFVVRKPERSDG